MTMMTILSSERELDLGIKNISIIQQTVLYFFISKSQGHDTERS